MRALRACLVFGAVAAIAACSGTGTTVSGNDDASAGDAAGVGDAASGDGSGGADGSGADSSTGGDASAGQCSATFPTYDKGCTNSQSCSVGFHRIDCCGSEIAVGFNHAYRGSFDQAEAMWRATCGGCKCVARPTLADDGKTAPDANIQVRCDIPVGATVGKCNTYVP